MSSIAATNRAAVEGPMPGTVISRLQSSSDFARSSMRCSLVRIFSVRRASIATCDATYSGSDSISAIRPAKVSALPLESRKPLAAQPAAQVVDQLGPRTDQRVVHPADRLPLSRARAGDVHRGQVDPA